MLSNFSKGLARSPFTYRYVSHGDSTNPLLRAQSHSHRSAVSGSVLAARRAGIHAAASVIALTTQAATTNVTGSVALTWNN